VYCFVLEDFLAKNLHTLMKKNTTKREREMSGWAVMVPRTYKPVFYNDAASTTAPLPLTTFLGGE
jgi:hypothetical protein